MRKTRRGLSLPTLPTLTFSLLAPQSRIVGASECGWPWVWVVLGGCGRSCWVPVGISSPVPECTASRCAEWPETPESCWMRVHVTRGGCVQLVRWTRGLWQLTMPGMICFSSHWCVLHCFPSQKWRGCGPLPFCHCVGRKNRILGREGAHDSGVPAVDAGDRFNTEEGWEGSLGATGGEGEPTSQYSARLWLSSVPTPSWVNLPCRLIIMAPSSCMSLDAEVISESECEGISCNYSPAWPLQIPNFIFIISLNSPRRGYDFHHLALEAEAKAVYSAEISERLLKCLWPGPHLLDKALGPYLGFLGHQDQTHVSCLIHHQALPPILFLAMHNVLLFFKILLKDPFPFCAWQTPTLVFRSAQLSQISARLSPQGKICIPVLECPLHCSLSRTEILTMTLGAVIHWGLLEPILCWVLNTNFTDALPKGWH